MSRTKQLSIIIGSVTAIVVVAAVFAPANPPTTVDGAGIFPDASREAAVCTVIDKPDGAMPPIAMETEDEAVDSTTEASPRVCGPANAAGAAPLALVLAVIVGVWTAKRRG